MAVDMKKAETLANQIRSQLMDIELKLAELQNMGFTNARIDRGEGTKMLVLTASKTEEIKL